MGPPSQQSHNAPPKATASAPVQNAPVMEEDPEMTIFHFNILGPLNLFQGIFLILHQPLRFIHGRSLPESLFSSTDNHSILKLSDFKWLDFYFTFNLFCISIRLRGCFFFSLKMRTSKNWKIHLAKCEKSIELVDSPKSF